MPKRTKKSAGSKGVLAIMMIAVLGAGALAAYVKFSPQASHVSIPTSEPAQTFSKPDVSVSSQPSASPKSGQLLVPAVIGSEVKLDKPADTAPEGVQPEVFLVNQTLQSLKIDGARAIGIDIKDRVALMDFNPGIQRGYGTMEEGYLIGALEMALGQFPYIDRFQIIVDGKAIETLGNIDLSSPLYVIRPGQKPDSNSSEDPTEPTPN